MKQKILLATALLLLGITVQANNSDISTDKIEINNYSDQMITFTERGIQFHVYLNGDFDFNTLHRNSRYYDYNGRRNGLRVHRDYEGRINRVGSVSISYDYYGNVKRIGYVRLKYRYNQLVKVGQLRISYRYGRPEFYGHVKHNDYDSNFGFSLYIGSVFDYHDHFFSGRDFRNNYRKYREDNNFYYYKSRSKKGKQKIIKRRKQEKRAVIKNSNSKRKSTYKKYDSKNPSKRNTVKKKSSKRKIEKRKVEKKRSKRRA